MPNMLQISFSFYNTTICLFSKQQYNNIFSLQGLSLLLEGSVSRGRNVHPIHKLLSRAPLQTQAGYSKLGRSFSLHPLLAWLRQALVPNPFGMSTCLRSGKKLAWAQQGMLLPPKVNPNVDHSFIFRCTVK